MNPAREKNTKDPAINWMSCMMSETGKGDQISVKVVRSWSSWSQLGQVGQVGQILV